MVAIKFPDYSFDPVAPDRRFFSVDADSESVFSKAVREIDNGEIFAPQAPATVIYPFVLPRLRE
jgi:hypothetical protein